MPLKPKIFILILLFGYSLSAYSDDKSWDEFVPPDDDKFDWIQLTSDEWLKGELKSLYHYKLEFDSDELDLQTFDIEDIRKIRTHVPFSVRIEDSESGSEPVEVTGLVFMNGKTVTIVGSDDSRTFPSQQLVSIAHSALDELDHWSGEIVLGTNVRKGNTESVDINLRGKVKRQAASSRSEISYIGHYTESDKMKTADNHRLSGYRDSYISKKLFWRQISMEYYRDQFKNIDHEVSVYSALGYFLVYSSKTKWDMLAGVGAKQLRYVSVEPGEDSSNTSPAFSAGSTYDTELSKAVDLLVSYQLQLVEEAAGKYTHHFITTIETDLTGDVDLDISFIWDRIEDPQVASTGEVPDRDDYQLVIGLNVDF